MYVLRGDSHKKSV